MSRKFQIWLIAVVTIAIVLNFGMYIAYKIAQHHAKVVFEEVKDHDQLYVYETYYKALNAAMYVEDTKDTTELISYYRKVEKRDTTAFFNFPIKSMPIGMYKPMYVYKYLTKGSNVIEMIDFNTKCWGYIKGYVYKPATHKVPPPDSLIKAEEEFVAKYNSDSRRKMLNRIAKKISDYGWWCDN